MKDRVKPDIGADEQPFDWDSIDWSAMKRRVTNLRRRIFRATANGQWNKVRSLMKLMLRSFSNLLVSVRKVTQENKGKKTPGIDRKVYLTSKSRLMLVKQLMEAKAWRVQPARRLYIPKPGGKKRPLGILTIQNRAAQAILKNALEPSWEARFESRSYGFRPGRSVHDAIAQCFRRLNRHCTHKWVLDADIRSAFDRISHAFILQKLGKIPRIGVIEEWLRAGYLEDEIFNDTVDGVQQGGVLSPVLANVALDGMEKLLGAKFGFIRYADDFVVTARTKEDLLNNQPVIEKWLATRGLELNTEKTKIVSIDEGFDFLSFNIRQYRNRTCIIKPQKEKVLRFLQALRDWLKISSSVTAAEVIKHLNPILSGWAQHYRCVNSKKTFCYVHAQLWRQLWRWCLRRHPKKSKDWVKKKYFKSHNGKEWTFFASQMCGEEMETLYLYDMSRLPIQRHVQVRGTNSPDNPDLKSYWKQRAERKHRILAKPGAIEYTVRKMLGA